MATLSARHQQLSAVAHTKRLLLGAGAIGLVSLAGTCAVHLPWNILDTQGRIVGFTMLAVADFVWLSLPIAAISYISVPQRLRIAWWMLILFDVVHAVMAGYLEADMVDNKQKFVEKCSTNSEGADCDLRIGTLTVATPIAAAFLPVCGGVLLYFLYRSFSSLPGATQRYASLYGDDADAAVPPGWHTPPVELAPDSSASESEDETDVTGRSGAGKGWYEMGKKGGREGGAGKGGRSGQLSWSEVRKARKERNLSKSGRS
ncbi:hypothetical protein JCM6882_008980 [Rhodosporidiobolus microsporus]